MNTSIRIIVADDHHLVRKGIVMLLSSLEGLEVVREGGNGEEILAWLRGGASHQADLALLDLEMPVMDGVETLQKVGEEFPDIPILMKDFIIDEYQIFEARAYGADAILLMTTILNAEELQRLGDCAQSLGMDVLYEAHDEQEISMLPTGARICGINSRKLDSRRLGLQHWLRRFLPVADHSIVSDRYLLADRLPAGSVRVAESGLSSENIGRVLQDFDAALVGTSLLLAADGVQAELARFEQALKHNPMTPGAQAASESKP